VILVLKGEIPLLQEPLHQGTIVVQGRPWRLGVDYNALDKGALQSSAMPLSHPWLMRQAPKKRTCLFHDGERYDITVQLVEEFDRLDVAS